MTTSKDTGPLDWRIAITDGTGRPTPAFQRQWNTQRNNNALIGTITFGTGAPTGTPDDGAEYVDISTNPYTLYVGQGGTWHSVTAIGANPTAIGSDTAVAGTAATFMRSDASPAIQKTSASQFGLSKVDGVSITASSGVISGPGVVLGFILNTGATGTNVGPELITARAGTFNKCVFVTKASDATTDLTFRIKKNGTDIFSTDPTITHGTASGHVSTFTSLTTVPFTFAAGDVFTIDITSGTATWTGTAQLEQ